MPDNFFDAFFPYDTENVSTEALANKSWSEMESSEIALSIHHKVEQAVAFFPLLVESIFLGVFGLCLIDWAVNVLHGRLRSSKVPVVPQNIADVDWSQAQDVKVNLTDADDDNDGVVLLESASVDETVLDFSMDVLRIGCKGLLAMMIASMLGIHTESLVVVFTSVSLGVSLALQPMLTDIVKGMIIIVFQPFRKGDLVTTSGLTGFVYEMTVFFTFIRSGSNMMYIIPNHLVGQVSNLSVQGSYRHDSPFLISNDEDYLRVKKLMEEEVKKHPMVLTTPAPEILCGGADDTGTTMIVRAFTLSKDIVNWAPEIEELMWNMFCRERVKLPRHCIIDPPAKNKYN